MSIAIDRMPGEWSGALDGSNKTPILGIKGKAMGGMISDTGMTFSVLVGLSQDNMVALEVSGAAATIVATADQAIIIPAEAFAFHFLQLTGTGAASVEICLKG